MFGVVWMQRTCGWRRRLRAWKTEIAEPRLLLCSSCAVLGSTKDVRYDIPVCMYALPSAGLFFLDDIAFILNEFLGTDSIALEKAKLESGVHGSALPRTPRAIEEGLLAGLVAVSYCLRVARRTTFPPPSTIPAPKCLFFSFRSSLFGAVVTGTSRKGGANHAVRQEAG